MTSLTVFKTAMIRVVKEYSVLTRNTWKKSV